MTYGTGIINEADDLYVSWRVLWEDGGAKIVDPDLWMRVTEVVPMPTTSMKVPMFDLTHKIAPWQGSRIEQGIRYMQIEAEANPYESTLVMDRDRMSDLNHLGLLRQGFRGMGAARANFFNQMVWPYLVHAAGGSNPAGGANAIFPHTALEKTWNYSTLVHDGQTLFSNTHPYSGGNNDNLILDGAGTDWWFVVDDAMTKPVGVGMYRAFDFYEYPDEVKRSNNRKWGQDGRMCVFPGDYRSIVACNGDLDDDSFRLALDTMAGFREDDGGPSGRRANTLIVSSANEIAGLEVLRNKLANGADNVVAGRTQLLVCRHIG